MIFIVKVFDEGFLTNKTPFYAQCGGQVGDTGVVILNGQEYPVIDTITLPNKQHLHIVENPLIFKEGDKVKLIVDDERRESLRENHSCCHLMFKALRETLGSHVSQQGSEISPETLRFDFNHFESLNDDTILKIEKLTNEYINNGFTQITKEVSIDEAKEMGAIAEFGEKYSDLVRVVNLGASIDVCGGTHVKNTKDIGKFMIQSIYSIGSGIYRITGLTKNMIEKEKDYFKGFIEEFHKLLNKAFEIEKKLSLSNIDKKFTYRPKEEYTFSYQDVINMRKELDLLQEEVKAFDKEATRLLNESIEKTFVNYKDMLTDKGGVIGLNEFERGYLRPLIDYLTSIKPNITVALVDKVSSKLQVLIKTNKDGVDASSLLKDALLIADGKGGGKKDFASGGAPSDSKYDEVIEFLRSKIL